MIAVPAGISDGSSAKYIVKAAMHNGLEAKAYKMDPEQIRFCRLRCCFSGDIAPVFDLCSTFGGARELSLSGCRPLKLCPVVMLKFSFSYSPFQYDEF